MGITKPCDHAPFSKRRECTLLFCALNYIGAEKPCIGSLCWILKNVMDAMMCSDMTFHDLSQLCPSAQMGDMRSVGKIEMSKHSSNGHEMVRIFVLFLLVPIVGRHMSMCNYFQLHFNQIRKGCKIREKTKNSLQSFYVVCISANDMVWDKETCSVIAEYQGTTTNSQTYNC